MAYLLSYTRREDALVAQNEAMVINSLHLAYLEGDVYDEKAVFTALNNHSGILFAKADYEENQLVGAYKTLCNPRINHEADGTFSIRANRGDADGHLDKGKLGQVLYGTTKDFIQFSEFQWQEEGPRNKVETIPNQVQYLDVATQRMKQVAVNGTQVIAISDQMLEHLLKRYGDLTDLGIVEEASSEDYRAFEINHYADPVVRYNPDNDKYYFMGTTGEDGNVTLTIREADTLLGLANAPAVPIKGDHGYSYEIGINDDQRKLLLWAPELHKIGPYWYCLFTSGGQAWDQQQSYLIRNTSGQLADPNAWETPVLYKQADGVTPLYTQGITLDMTYIQDGETHYVMWAQRETIAGGGQGIGNSDLWIATIDPHEPSVITSPAVMVARAEYGWEKRTTDVLEGPFAIIKDGTIYVTYSGSGVDATYCVGCLTAQVGSDLLDPKEWQKMPSPLLTTENGGEKGPGHCSFCQTREGDEVFIYHFFPGSYDRRSARARRLYWSQLGLPVLNWHQ